MLLISLSKHFKDKMLLYHKEQCPILLEAINKVQGDKHPKLNSIGLQISRNLSNICNASKIVYEMNRIMNKFSALLLQCLLVQTQEYSV